MLETLGTNGLLLAGIFMLVLLSLAINLVSLVTIMQMKNNQKRKQNGYNPTNDGKKHSNPNKKHEPRQNQNNNRPTQQNQVNQNKPQQANGGEKKYEKIGSNLQSLKETNAQLANRPRPQQGNKKVYSERPAGNVVANANNNAPQKQERPANAPIKQQELPKPEVVAEPTHSIKPAVEKTTEIKAEKIAEVVAEVKTEAASVQYGRR